MYECIIWYKCPLGKQECVHKYDLMYIFMNIIIPEERLYCRTRETIVSRFIIN